MILQNARAILPDRIAPQTSVRIRDERIVEIGQTLQPGSSEAVLDLNGAFLSPGFIDLHIHGAKLRDTMEASPEAFAEITAFHLTGGTTSLALTTVTASHEDILKVLRAVDQIDPESFPGSRILGVHIEGPYFSLQKPGAHVLDLIRHPNPTEYREWLEFRHLITQMTFAPELPGSLDLIDALLEAGVKPSAGHSDAWDEEVAAAAARGLRQTTHTFNCMSSARKRGPERVAGLVEYAMGEPDFICELIADGAHVSPTLMRALYRAKGPDHIALVTDAAGGAGLPEGTKFQIGEIRGVVGKTASWLEDGSALCSSTARMNELVRNMVRLVGAPLHEAVRMASLTPAKAIGIDHTTGSIATDLKADLLVLDENLEVKLAFINGQRRL